MIPWKEEKYLYWKEKGMKEQPSIKINFILSNLYQIVSLITPLITAPYISRVLGAEGVGIYSYTGSFQTFFSMFAALGTVSYGAREIARNRRDSYMRSKLFWEIELMTIGISGCCIVLWLIWSMMNSKYRSFYLMWTFSLLATMFDISWFYTGIEQLKHVVVQNTIFKLLGIIALFIFVNDNKDVALYIAIMALCMFLGNLSMWIYLPGYLIKVKKKDLAFQRHFRETFIYFIPTVANSLYTVLDKALLGAITQDQRENGYYEQATKIINMSGAITYVALNRVMMSRISYLFARGQLEEVKKKISQSIDYIFFIGFALCFGMVGVADIFIPLFFGEEYEKTIILLKMMSPLVVIIGISNCLGAQYYTPIGFRKKSTKYIILGSVINLVFNLVLIPQLKSMGAVLSTLFAEIAITTLYLANCNCYLCLKQLCILAWKKIIAAMVMLLSICCVKKMCLPMLSMMVIQIIVGGLVYITILFFLRDTFSMEMRKYVAGITRKFRKGKKTDA